MMPISMLHAVPAVMAAVLVPAGIAGTVHAVGKDSASATTAPAAIIVTVQPGSIAYPQPGEFLKDGHPQKNPRVSWTADSPLTIMAYQVSSADYALCVQAGECEAPAARSDIPADAPVTGVSYLDATDYARWYSEVTGETWRLPTDAEWALAAAERFVGEYQGIEDDPKNPARRWLSNYSLEAERSRDTDAVPRVRGAFGANSNGLYDLSGNVWEWTSTCYVRVTMTPDGKALASSVDNCGVHVLEGRHRAYMSNFVSDGKSGGCAAGTPPANLGFRLVLEPPSLVARAFRFLGMV